MPPNTTDAFERASSLEVDGGGLSGQSKGTSPLESMISVEFATGSLPVAQANAEQFVQLIRETLGAQLVTGLSLFLASRKIDLANLTLKQLDSAIPHKITFADGFIEYEDQGQLQYVHLSTIVVLALGGVIRVGAYGTTEDAERALGKVCECIFTAAGMSQQWAEAKTGLIARGHATSSSEVLDGSLDRILSERLVNFVETHLRGSQLVSKIGVLPLNQSTGEPHERDYEAVVKLGELELDVIRLDLRSGDRYETKVVIHPEQKVTAGKGRYVVVSELEYSQHQRLVKELKEALNG